MAGGRATISIDLITVIASFITRLPFSEIDASDTVAAGSDRAGVSTGIVVFIIAIIARFVLIDLPITAGTQAAQIITPVILNLVSVIAAFKTGVDDAIAATRLFATVATLVGIYSVAIIASLDACSDLTIAAGGDSARI